MQNFKGIFKDIHIHIFTQILLMFVPDNPNHVTPIWTICLVYALNFVHILNPEENQN